MAEQQRSPASAPARREPSHATQLLLQARLETDRTLSPAERVASITSPSEGVDRAEYRAISPVERSQRARQQREERWKRTGADDGSRAVAEMAMTRVKALAVRINEMDDAHEAEKRARMMLEATLSSQLDIMHVQQREIDALKARVREVEAEAGLASPSRRSPAARTDSASYVATAPTLSPLPATPQQVPQQHQQRHVQAQERHVQHQKPHEQQAQQAQQAQQQHEQKAQQHQQQAQPHQKPHEELHQERPLEAVPPSPAPAPPTPPGPQREAPTIDQRREALQRQVSQRREPDPEELQKRKRLLQPTEPVEQQPQSAAEGGEAVAGPVSVHTTHEQMVAADPQLEESLQEFRAADLNQDGVLDGAELPQIFHWLHYDEDVITPEYIDSVLQQYGDGAALTFEQFIPLWEELSAHHSHEQEAEVVANGSQFLVTSEATEHGTAVRYGPSTHVAPTLHWRLYPGTHCTVLCVDGDWAQLAAPSFEANKDGGVEVGWVQYKNRLVPVGDSTSPKGGGKKLQTIGRRMRSPIRPRKDDPGEQQAVVMRAAGPLLQLGDGEPEPLSLEQLLPAHDMYGMTVGRKSLDVMLKGIEVWKFAASSTKKKRLFLTLSSDLTTLGWGTRPRAFDHSVPVRSLHGRLYGPRGANMRRYKDPKSKVKLEVPEWHIFSYFIQEQSVGRRSLDFGAISGERDAFHAYLAMEFIANGLAYPVRPGPVLWAVARMRAMQHAKREGSSLSHFISEAMLAAAYSDDQSAATRHGDGLHVGGSTQLKTVESVFELYDTNLDGVLDVDEISALLDALHYEVDQAYIDDVVGSFGRPGDGLVGIQQFPALWEHLDGEPLQPALADEEPGPPQGDPPLSAQDAALLTGTSV